jgi:hypothetical protein
MFEKPRLAVGSLIIITSLLSFGGCARQAQPPKSVPIVSPAPAATGQTVTGFTAVSPTEAKITEAQVRDYVASHPMPRADSQNVAIKSVTFMGAGQVRSALQSPALSASMNRPLVLVVMTGTFVFTGPPGTKASYAIGFEVFDAQTGHLLQFGGLPREPRISVR